MSDKRKKEQPLPELLSISQAAAALGVTRSGISHAIERGKLTVMRFGNVTLIPRAALEQYNRTKSKGGRPRKRK